MRINRLEFVILMLLSVFMVKNTFILADMERGFNATGGEIFSLLIPAWVIFTRLKTIKKEK